MTNVIDYKLTLVFSGAIRGSFILAWQDKTRCRKLNTLYVRAERMAEDAGRKSQVGDGYTCDERQLSRDV